MRSLFLAALISFGATGSLAATVDFEGLSTSFLSSSETIDGFTFNAQNGSSVRIFNDNPNPRTTYILACNPGNCENPLEIIFPNVTSSFSMNVVSEDVFDASLNLAFQTASGIVNFVFNSFDGNGQTKDLVNFDGLDDATSVLLSPSDPSGFGYDDITVDDTMGTVPLPAGLPLLLTSLGILGITRSRKS